MTTLRFNFFITFLLLNGIICAQAIDQTLSSRQIESETYLRLHYENDFFANRDFYFTQGISLEMVSPVLRANPVNYLLLRPRGYNLRYGIALEHNGFTPTVINNAEILADDRPFAGCLFLKSFIIAEQPEKNIRIASALSSGIIGHLSNADCIQIAIHKWTNDIIPLGWDNQVKNDIILNYRLQAEKKLVAWKNYLLLNAYGELNVGSLIDKAGTGIVFKFGILQFPFERLSIPEEHQTNTKNRFRFFIYCQPIIELVGYNATLQGGLFNEKSPYTLKSGEIERFVIKNNAGIVSHIGKLYIEYFQTILTKEFKAGIAHRWGGIRIGMTF